MFKSLSEWVLVEKKESRSFSALSKKLGFVSRQTLTTWASDGCVSFVSDENLTRIAGWLSEKYPQDYKNINAETLRELWDLSDASQSRYELNKKNNEKKGVNTDKESEVLLYNLINRIDYLEKQLGDIRGAISAMAAGNEVLANRVLSVEQQLSLRGDKIFT